MRESYIEKRLMQEVKKRGGLAMKFVSPSLTGVPDRIVLLPGGRIAFVEVKAPGQKMRPLQLRRKEQLSDLGFKVYILDSIEMIGGIIDEIQAI